MFSVSAMSCKQEFQMTTEILVIVNALSKSCQPWHNQRDISMLRQNNSYSVHVHQ